MKKVVLLIGIFLSVLCAQAQEGVNFQNLKLSEAMAKAQEEKKMIFIDFYTVWCGPCKQMSKEVFSQREVGEYFNPKFISLKLDAEKGEGKELAGKFKIRAYPTFVVLDADGSEVYRTSGSRPASDFLEKIRKGIDPKWSPEGLTKRFDKGERTPELVHDFAILQMENNKVDEGFQIINDYFNGLSAKKKVRPENFFLYREFAENLSDPKILYLFNNKDEFLKANDQETVDLLLYKWLRARLMHFVTLRSAQPVSEEGLQKLKEDICKADLKNSGYMKELVEIAEVRVRRNMKDYIEICKEKFPILKDADRFSILLTFSELNNEPEEVRTMAAALMQDNLEVTEGLNQRILKIQMYGLEGKKVYRLIADIEGGKSGKVVVMNFSPKGFMRDTIAFAGNKINIELPGKDTTVVSMRILCEELGAPTAKIGTHYPNVSFLFVPGENAFIKIKAEKGKEPKVEWVRGGEISHDYIRLNYEQVLPAEEVYRQLIVDNIIQGGDIRNYRTEFDAYMVANKQRIMDFIRNNPTSYVSLMKLLEHYTWFDENEIDRIYSQQPENFRNSVYGRVISRKLAVGKGSRIGDVAPDFTKKDMKGRPVVMSQMKGKYILLDFWGSWCGPCRSSHPHLKELYKKYGNDVIFINVASEMGKTLEKSKQTWQQAVKEDGLSWTQVLNEEEIEQYNLVRLYNVTAFPTKILIDSEGKIVSRMVGTSWDAGVVLQEKLGR